MAQTYWFFLALDYFCLNMISYYTIENYLLDRYASPSGIYNPLYSELFSIESILLYMIIAGAALAMKANRKSSSQETSRYFEYLAILFAVLAVPARLMTKSLIDCDTIYFAFVMFFSSLLLYCSLRNWLDIKFRMCFKELAAVFAILAMLFWVFEPWNSPSLKLTNAIKAGNASSFITLSRKYPQHTRMNSGLLNTAFARPVPEIIKTIVESGNTSISTGYMNLEIFNPAHIDMLAYLHAKGVNFASIDMLRNAVRYSAVATDKSYPVLRFLLKLHHENPEESQKQHSENSGCCGWKNLVSIAAAAGDSNLMAFLVDQGFVIDEEVYQALALNKHNDKPGIQALLKKSRFVSEKQSECSIASQSAIPVISATAVIIEKPDFSDSMQLRLEPDGFDLILTSGADVKRYRENQQNIFHFLADKWCAREPGNQHHNIDFAGVFREAMKRNIDLNKKDIKGLTPLWLALQANNFRAFARLLEAGADQSARNSEGVTMIEFCNKNNRKILLSLLSEVGPHEK